MKKFKVQEQEMTDKEQRHKETLYEVERNFIIGKDKYVCELQKFLAFVPLSFVMKYYFCVLFLLLICINLQNFCNQAKGWSLFRRFT